MKKNIVNKLLSLSVCGLLSLSVAVCFTGCKDYLTEIEPGTTLLEDFYTSTDAAVQNVTGCYTPLMWEYNHTYLSEWFIGDIASDDAIKGGGSTTDMSDAYDIENWRTTDQNTLLLDFYRAQYQGIGRCNLALEYIGKTEVGIDEKFTEQMKNRLLGEVHFLRAYYYFRLVRVFAGVPMPLEVLSSSDKWGMPRASVDAVYTQILADLAIANQYLPLKSQYDAADLGRATKGAAQAMLMKVNLYMASPFWQKKGVSKSAATCYSDAKAWGDSIITSGEYSLCTNYEDNFTVAGENGPESVFEIQYAEVAWGDYGEGFGYTAGSFSQILMRSRNSEIGGGWGFDHPTQNLYDEFEAGDPRRDVAILIPSTSIVSSYQPQSDETYLGNNMLNNKYGMYRDPAAIGGGYGKWSLHASRGPLNNKQIRYADVLLMYAEACLGTGDAGTAKSYIDQVRNRVGLGPCAAADDATLRHERRCELAMEGHRWFDLVRWEGVAGTGLKAHMDAYKLTETAEAQSHIQEFVAGKHELFPIPQEERQLNPTEMEQNPGY
ncbi:MAG: RagB/SusD family nutrient uptake outer membrane protein [Paludibacteraceae bacterium]|nr:RagB/SusD family nutrient uptake outer membrane protein [Paludibacteraceae bacterium]